MEEQPCPCPALSAAPIHHWTAMHVWLYIFREKALYNPLYEQGLDRIGCYMCPSSDIAILEKIRARYPVLWGQWTKKLEEWGEKHGLPPEWISEVRWRKRDKECSNTGNRVIERELVTTDEEDSNC